MTGRKTPSFERQRRTWGTLTYSYNRCALIITPEDSATVDFAVGDVREFACMALKSSTSETPTAKEQRLVEALLAWLTKNRTVATTEASVLALNSTVAKVLRDSAVRWNSADLFLKTLEGCGLDQCIKVAGIDVLLSGYRSFDWGIFKAVYSEILSKTMSITLRARLIDDILATGQSDSDVLSWCETQKELALDTFQKLDVSGIDWIMKVVQSKQDPTDYLRTVLIPRLHSVQPYNLQVWAALLTYVEKCPSESPAWTGTEHLEIIRACLGRVASEMPPYRTAKQKTYSNPPYTLVPTVDPILSILELGTRFNCFQVCLPLLHNMFLQRERQKTAHPKRPPNEYYSALVPKVEKFLQAKPELSQFLEPFFSQAASVLLSSNSTLTTFTQELRTALLRSRDAIKILQTFLTADRVKALVAGQGVSLKYLSTFMSENLRSQADSSESLTTLQGMLKLCLTGMIGSFNQSSLTNYYRSNDGIELLTHCFTLQLSSDVDQVLARFLALPLSNEPGYIQNGLVSLLKHLPKFLTTQQLSLLDAPFSTFAAEIAKKFVRYTIGTRPSQVVSLRELQAVGCGCEPCRTSLVPFLTNDLPKVDIRVTAATQTHLEHQLMFAKKWGFTWTTIRQGTLQVVKPQRMIDVGRWAGAQTRGYAFLGLLGDDQQQRQILGSDYVWVTGTIAGTATPPALPLETQANGTKRGPDASSGQSKKPRLS
ncbi:hypothetical protein BDZ89DRAFT_203658 [Hymenopellis radicata]|nr:hypothetical protein BDZ89DRAFT_203658 [Hymenopellis radicata]